MKKAVIFIFLCFLLVGLAEAQQIKASVLEGCWVWNGRGEEPWFGVEVIFFGNVVLMKETKNDEIYLGGVFTIDSTNITIPAEDEGWRYSLSGNTLTLTDTVDGETASYTKAAYIESPLEGIWMPSEIVNYDYDENIYLFFTRNIMGVYYVDECMAYTVSFSGDSINFGGDKASYSVSGNTLTISAEGESIILTKIY